ncbi:hypothetical protein [Pseudarthrobacter sp. S9]|uniref:hypothetical protein n=1 Tax=Pseudarthrobacter sp. S9 TaxID=3418421 RepID=UPI003CFCDDBB
MDALESVSVGMKVIDAEGRELGKVEFVRAPDPKAAALEERVVTAGETLINLGIGSVVGAEPKVPPEMALRLFRQGYIKIDGRGFWAADYYAAGDAISRVEGRTVHLSLNRHELDAQE